MDKKQQIKELQQDLCDSIMCDLEVYECCTKRDGSCGRCQRVAEDLYNADYRKQIRGEWTDTGDGELDQIYSGYKCSACGFVICGYSGNYCPDCGAKMKPYRKKARCWVPESPKEQKAVEKDA